MIEQLPDFILPSLEHFHLFAYWLAFIVAFLETALLVGLLIPGSTLLLLLGAYSASGQLEVGILIWFAVAGAILGDNLNYFLGRRYGQRWTEHGLWFLRPEHFATARQFFDQHGARSVFLGRFVPSIKEVVPFIAGTLGMHRSAFFFWNVLGATGWGFIWIGSGYLFAQSLSLAATWLSRLGMSLTVLLLLIIFLWFIKQRVFHHGRSLIQFSESLLQSIGTALNTNPGVIAFVERHTTFFDFMKKRVRRKQFSGLPLTLLGLAFLYVLALFGGIIEDLITLDPIVYADQNVAQIIAALRSQPVIQIFIWITELGMWQLLLPLLGISALILISTQRYLLVLPLLVSSIGSAVFVLLGKLAFHRSRPADSVLFEHSYSFPSGHATLAVAFYGFLSYLFIRHSNQWSQRVNLFFISASLILLIGISRLVLGVHYLSDVWAGYLLGTLWLIIGIGLTEWLIANGRVSIRDNVTANITATTTTIASSMLTNTLVAGAFLYVVCFAVFYQPIYAPEQKVTTVQVNGNLPQLLIKNNQQYSETLLGTHQQPVSLVLVAGNETILQDVFRMAGWLAVDKTSLKNLARSIEEGMTYTRAPLAPGFWNSTINYYTFVRPQILDDKKQTNSVLIWRTPYRAGNEKIFIAVVRMFDGQRWGLLHNILPDVDTARELLLQSFEQTNRENNNCTLSFIKPEVGDFPGGGHFFTHGKLQVISLNRASAPPSTNVSTDICGHDKSSTE